MNRDAYLRWLDEILSDLADSAEEAAFDAIDSVITRVWNAANDAVMEAVAERMNGEYVDTLGSLIAELVADRLRGVAYSALNNVLDSREGGAQ